MTTNPIQQALEALKSAKGVLQAVSYLQTAAIVLEDVDAAIAALSQVASEPVEPVYKSLHEIPTKTLAARVVGSLILCKGNLNEYQLTIEALIGGLRASPQPADQQSSAPEASELKPCPCGKVPTDLCITDTATSKWANVSGNCCSEWMIEFCTNYKPIDSAECKALATESWQQAARQARPCVPEWISVNDRLPEMGRGKKAYVWIYGKEIEGFNNVILARFTGTKFKTPDDDLTVKPTHWMPLPSAPIVGVQSNGEEG